MRTRSLVLLCCLSLLFAMHGARAQNAQDSPTASEGLKHRTPESIENERAASRHITIDVNVTDAAGKPVTGLEQQDFKLLDNRQPQAITSFHAVQSATANPPTEVVLLIDLINTSFQRIAFERQQVEKFLQQDGGHLPYPVRLVLVSETGIEIQPQTSQDGNALVELLDNAHTGIRAIGRAAGAAGAAERLQMSLRSLDQLIAYEGQKPGRKLMLWISPGWPMLASPGFTVTNNQQRWIFNSIAGFTNSLRKARITLYAIDPLGAGEGLGNEYYYESFLKPVTAAKQVNYGNLGLQVLSVHSGGIVVPASNDLTAEINRCVADTEAYYVLSFESTPTEKADEYHALTVEVDKSGAKVRTSTGYYAEP